MRKTQVRSLGQEDPLEKEMATHSSTLAWKIPGRLQSTGSQRGVRQTERLHFHWTLKARSFVVVPWPEMEPMAPAVLAGILTMGSPGKSLMPDSFTYFLSLFSPILHCAMRHFQNSLVFILLHFTHPASARETNRIYTVSWTKVWGWRKISNTTWDSWMFTQGFS